VFTQPADLPEALLRDALCDDWGFQPDSVLMVSWSCLPAWPW
jgi:hypothetical protein